MLKLDCDAEVLFTFRGANEKKQVQEASNVLGLEKVCQG